MNKISKFAHYLIKKYGNEIPYDSKFFLMDDGWSEGEGNLLEDVEEEMDEPEWQDTVFQDVENIDNIKNIKHTTKPIPEALPVPEQLPSLIQGFLEDLIYMNRQELIDERIRIRNIIKDLLKNNIQPTYPLKMRLSEIDRRLMG